MALHCSRRKSPTQGPSASGESTQTVDYCWNRQQTLRLIKQALRRRLAFPASAGAASNRGAPARRRLVSPRIHAAMSVQSSILCPKLVRTSSRNGGYHEWSTSSEGQVERSRSHRSLGPPLHSAIWRAGHCPHEVNDSSTSRPHYPRSSTPLCHGERHRARSQPVDLEATVELDHSIAKIARASATSSSGAPRVDHRPLARPVDHRVHGSSPRPLRKTAPEQRRPECWPPSRFDRRTPLDRSRLANVTPCERGRPLEPT
jgi:hypothetical protein